MLIFNTIRDHDNSSVLFLPGPVGGHTVSVPCSLPCAFGQSPFPCRRRHRRRRRRSAHPLHAAGQPRSGGARRHDFGRGAASRQRRRTCACASRFLLPRRRSGRCGTCGECPRACVARPFRNRRLGRCRNRNLRSRLPRGVGIDRRNPRRRGGEGRFHRPRCFDESIRRSAGKSRLRRPDRPDRLVQQPGRTALRSQFRNGQRRRPLCAGERRARNCRVGKPGMSGRRYARPDRFGGGRAERLRPEDRRNTPYASAGKTGRGASSGSLGRSGRGLSVRSGAVFHPGTEWDGSGVRTVGQERGGGGADTTDGDSPGQARQRKPGVLRLSRSAAHSMRRMSFRSSTRRLPVTD